MDSDQSTIDWVSTEVPKINDLWEGSDLSVLAKADIPEISRAKVCIPMIVLSDGAVPLQKSQYKDFLTEDWKNFEILDFEICALVILSPSDDRAKQNAGNVEKQLKT